MKGKTMIKKKKPTTPDNDYQLETYNQFDTTEIDLDENVFDDFADLKPNIEEPEYAPAKYTPPTTEETHLPLGWTITETDYVIEIEALDHNSQPIKIPAQYKIHIRSTNEQDTESTITTIVSKEDALNDQLSGLVLGRVKSMATQIKKAS